MNSENLINETAATTGEPLTVPEVLTNPQEVSIATITYYPSWHHGASSAESSEQIRGNLSLRTIESAVASGYKVTVIDGGSSREFIEAASRLGVTPIPQTDEGMSGARRQALRETAKDQGVQVICITEPEKLSLVEDFMPALALPILEGKADIVIPGRSETSYSTYPEHQIYFEQRSNRLFNQLMRASGLTGADSPDLDMFMGPRVLRNDPELIKLFMKRYHFEAGDLNIHRAVNTEAWANTLFFPVMAALEKGWRVANVTVNYEHPGDQTANEIGNSDFDRKREIQSRGILTAVIHYLKLSKEKSSHLSQIE